LLISALGIVPDVRHTCTMDLKAAGDLVYLVGETGKELGGSFYYRLHGLVGNSVPGISPAGPATARALHRAIGAGLVRACHDCSEGGLAVALAEMAFAGGLGIEADLRGLPKSDDCSRTDTQLFSESNSRYIVEVEPENYNAFAKLMLNLPFGHIGKVTEEKTLIIKAQGGKTVIESDINSLKQAWQKTFDW